MLDDNVQYLKGIGPKKAEVLKSEAGIETVEDLLHYAPRKYVDRSLFKPIVDTFQNEVVTVAGYIDEVKISGRKKRFLEVVISDDTDSITGVFFGGVKYFQKIFTEGDFVLFSGKIDFFRKKQIVHPEFDFIDEDSTIKSINTGRVIPLYRSTEKLKGLGLDSRGFRRIIRTALDGYVQYVEDPFDATYLDRLNIIPLKDALVSIHYPLSYEDAENARRRLAYDELFFLQYYLAISRGYSREVSRRDIKNFGKSDLEKELLSSLPFELTSHQKTALQEIRSDLQSPYPMTRLMQGDVGSGKTIVAMLACVIIAERGCQSALMAPTEVLVNQHYQYFKQYLPASLECALLTSSTPQKEKKEIYERTSNGEIDILIGTHALIQEKVKFKDLGFIIIDEQHRFGVNQRAKLRDKGESPDLLIMTATPIPRSLSLTLYGDLDVSYIKEKPANRLPVKTFSFPESRLGGVYNSIEKYVSQGRQVFYVLPLIQESQKMDLRSATEVYEKLKNDIFPESMVEILHGKQPQADKELTMKRFVDGQIDILVSTTVIEVGIDVPNANVMIIHHSERFGLSQLHQLRGRVGRGEHQSFCTLIYPDNISRESKERLDVVVETDDGFKIAEEDLKSRGSGDILGIKQHGHNSGFEFANLATDLDLILNAKEEAEKSIEALSDLEGLFSDLNDSNKLRPLLKGIRTKRVLSILS